jgi:dienelactone hydrolase
MINSIFCAGLIIFYCHTASATLTSDSERGAIALQAMVPDVHEKIIQIPTENTPPVLLQVTVYTPEGSGPFPLVILNHGSADYSPKEQLRSRLSFATLYFLSRGYAVAQPMMRGYAGSGGQQPAVGCDIIAISDSNALDIRRVIQYMSTQPNIDGSRVIVAGQSYGGYNALAVGTLDLPSVKGLIDFNGTMLTKVCPDDLNRTINAVGYYAARTHVPSIWFYGTNDKLIAESTWRAAYRRYNLLGGDATLVSFGNFKEDSHNLLGHVESLAIIAPPIDDFLHKIGLPNTLKYPGYVPSATPLSSHFADINDVSAVPIDEKDKIEYLKFLKMPLPRAFFIDENDGIIAISGGLNPEEKSADLCKQRKIKCWTYAVDNQVVWVKPNTTPIPPPSHYADIHDVDAVPVSPAAREAYQKFLSLPLPRVFMISKNVAFVITGGLDPLGKALLTCQQRQIQCWPYAIDQQVVWVRPNMLTPIPPPSKYADINDTHAITVINEHADSAYQNFLKMPLPRAFVISSEGELYANQGGLDPLGQVLEACQKNVKVCVPYAVDNQVVWSPTADFLKPTHFADIHDYEAVPYMQVAGRKMYQKFLTLNNPRVFVIAPDGTSTMASSGSKSLQIALSKCQSNHRACAVYALDNDVVWLAH